MRIHHEPHMLLRLSLELLQMDAEARDSLRPTSPINSAAASTLDKQVIIKTCTNDLYNLHKRKLLIRQSCVNS